MNIIFITENVSRQGNPNFESAERWREILCGVEKETRDGLRILMDIVRIVGQKSKSEERLAVKILLFFCLVDVAMPKIIWKCSESL